MIYMQRHDEFAFALGELRTLNGVRADTQVLMRVRGALR